LLSGLLLAVLFEAAVEGRFAHLEGFEQLGVPYPF
jgi:hypothetical protein